MAPQKRDMPGPAAAGRVGRCSGPFALRGRPDDPASASGWTALGNRRWDPGRALGGVLGATVLLGAQLAGGTTAAAPEVLLETNGALVAKLTGSHEVPPVSTSASGSARVTVVGGALFYQVVLSGLPAPTAVDISLGAIGANGPIVFAIPVGAGVLSGELGAANLAPSAGLSFDQAVAAILAGGSYVNVHSAAAPGGEIRGQLEPELDHPIYTITAGAPPGGTGDVSDFFPRTLTVPTGAIVRFVVSGQHTATLLPAGTTAAQDSGIVTTPTGCGTDASPCFFDGTTTVGVGPPAPGSTITLVVYIGAPPGTYVLHSRLQPAMVGVVNVASPGSPDISSADDVAAAIAAQLAAGPPVTTPTSMYSGRLGFDISYPDCPRGLPASIPGSFGVIGVNGGKMFRYNACLAAEFELAKTSGLPALYINTNAAYGSTAHQGASGPAGTCAAKDKLCYGYNYGYNAARAAWRYAFHQLGPANLPSTWWLDVELGNSWFTRPDHAANARVIQGALDFLGRPGAYGAPSMGYTVGIYSTTYQWQKIVGTAYRPGMPVWYATVEKSPGDALDYCPTPTDRSSSFTGGPVWMIQYQSGKYDVNVGCP